MKTVQEVLGHSTIRLTADTYGHLMPGDDGRAADAMERAVGSVARSLAVNLAVKRDTGRKTVQSRAPDQDFFGGDDGTRTHDFLLANSPGAISLPGRLGVWAGQSGQRVPTSDRQYP